eukprot:gene25048-biopygen20944
MRVPPPPPPPTPPFGGSKHDANATSSTGERVQGTGANVVIELERGGVSPHAGCEFPAWEGGAAGTACPLSVFVRTPLRALSERWKRRCNAPALRFPTNVLRLRLRRFGHPSDGLKVAELCCHFMPKTGQEGGTPPWPGPGHLAAKSHHEYFGVPGGVQNVKKKNKFFRLSACGTEVAQRTPNILHCVQEHFFCLRDAILGADLPC